MLTNPYNVKPSRPSFNAKDKDFLYQRQGGKCAGCAVKLPMRQLAVDHVKPFSKGGSDKPSNLQLLCTPCNSIKKDGTQAQLMKRLKEKGIVKAAPKTPAKAKAPAKKKSASAKKKSPPIPSIFGF